MLIVYGLTAVRNDITKFTTELGVPSDAPPSFVSALKAGFWRPPGQEQAEPC